MTYFLVSKDEDGGITLETFEAKNNKAYLFEFIPVFKIKWR